MKKRFYLSMVLSNLIKRIVYALPFGLKAANDEINSQVNNGLNSEKLSVEKQVSSTNLAESLLKGEVTQEVEELRYSVYKVSEESKRYKYLGNGTSVKRDVAPVNFNKIKFSMQCKLEPSSVVEELNQIESDEYYNEYTLKVSYNEHFPIYKIEKFAQQIDININNKKGERYCVLHFNSVPTPDDSKTGPFIDELKKIKTSWSNLIKNNANESVLNAFIDKTELLSSIGSISFSTYKATNDFPDMITFLLLGLKFVDIKKSNAEYRLKFTFSEHEISDLVADKFYSKTMDEKYKNKERRKNTTSNALLDISDKEHKVFKCSSCGKVIDKSDYSITKYDFGEPLCKECLEKKLSHKNIFS